MNDIFPDLKDVLSPDKFCLYVYFREWEHDGKPADEITFNLALDLHRKLTPENYLPN